jgi:hypothetical protein
MEIVVGRDRELNPTTHIATRTTKRAGCFVERGNSIARLRAVRHTPDPGAAHRVIADAPPPALASVLSPEEFEVMRQKLSQLPEPPRRPSLTKNAWLGAGAVFLAVFLSTFPVVIPFLFINSVRLALRLSNGVLF